MNPSGTGDKHSFISAWPRGTNLRL